MKLHISAVERLIRTYENYGGHRNEQKLKNILSELDFSVYERKNGENIVVMTEDYEKEKNPFPRS